MTVPSSSRLIRYFALTSRWFLIIGAVFVLTFTVGHYLIDHVARKAYHATTEIQVVPPGVAVESVRVVPDAQAQDPQTQLGDAVKEISSPLILSSVVNDLGLDRAWARRIYDLKEDELTPDQALDHMREILKVELVPQTNLISISATSDVPEEATDIANAVADRYKISHDAEAFKREAHDYTGTPPPPDSVVGVVSRATIPAVPTSSHFAALLTVAIVLSVFAASFAEVLLLFSRAGERSGNY
jgi:capsular polysaccharide biosynthesis protein